MAIKTGKIGYIQINTDSVAFTTEATAEEGSTKIYQIGDTGLRTWDPNTPITLTDAGGKILDKSYYDDGVNWFEGKVKMTGTGLTDLKVTGKSMTLRKVGEVHNWALTLTIDVGEDTEIGDTWKTNLPLGKSASLTISRYRIDTLFDQGEGGYQECGMTDRYDALATGLAGTNDYDFKINVDGGGEVTETISTVADMTYAAVIALINAELTNSYCHIVNGDLRFTSKAVTGTSTIALAIGTVNNDLFDALDTWIAFDTAVVGSTEPDYYILKLYEDDDSGFFCKVLQTTLGITKAVGAIDAESTSFEVSANVSYFS